MDVAFHGVRGSFPCSNGSNQRYGGHTASVALRVDGEPPLFLDLGSGLPSLDLSVYKIDQPGRPFEAAALVTHLHFDHVQGLPFFPPTRWSSTSLDIYGPRQETGTLRDAFSRLIAPPYFPVSVVDFPATLRFHDVLNDDFTVGRASVTVRPVPHKGPTVGYRVAWDGVVVAYISDHQAPLDLASIDDRVVELCADVDLLIHDAQYTRAEFLEKHDWGHCTIDYAVHVARESGARRLCLFHHDPSRADEKLDEIVARARRTGVGGRLTEVIAAIEGATIRLEAR